MNDFWKLYHRMEETAKSVDTVYRGGYTTNEKRSIEKKQQSVNSAQPKKKGWRAWLSKIRKSESNSS